MRCHVVLDKKGQVVAVGYVEVPEPEALLEPEAEYRPIPTSGPEAEEGQTVVEVDVPGELARMPVADFVARLQVDAQAQLEKAK
jgi:hypothetical protein